MNCVNFQGAIFGSLVAVAVITLMCIGQQIYIASGSLQEVRKETCISGCFGATTELPSIVEQENISSIG